MGKCGLRVFHVPKLMTVALLLLVILAMAGSIYYLSGRAYAKHGAAEAVEKMVGSTRPLTNVRVIAALLPLIADLVTFVPFGFLFFVAADRPAQGRSMTYAWTFMAALLLSAGFALWQATSLPTRVTTYADSLPNAAGACAGALMGHLRKKVRLRFQ